MSDDNPLSRKISTLLAENTFDGPALHLGKSGTPDALSHILTAIDDTMLLRHAVFAVGDSAVTLRISGKRVLRVVAVTDDLAAPEGLIDQQLSADTTEALQQLAQVLARLVAKKGVLTLERAPAEASAKQAGSGVGIQVLAAAFKVGKKTVSQDGMATFVDACVNHAVATVEIVDEKVSNKSGSQPKVAKLKQVYGDFWASFEKNHDAQITTPDRDILRIVEIPSAGNLAFVHAKIKEKQCLALVKVDRVAVLASVWALVADQT
jgi:hypothetical protein